MFILGSIHHTGPPTAPNPSELTGQRMCVCDTFRFNNWLLNMRTKHLARCESYSDLNRLLCFPSLPEVYENEVTDNVRSSVSYNVKIKVKKTLRFSCEPQLTFLINVLSCFATWYYLPFLCSVV